MNHAPTDDEKREFFRSVVYIMKYENAEASGGDKKGINPKGNRINHRSILR